jgi:tetratricopeptide (TPR) repeat protein
MPGHIFARLGLWDEDIEANTASVAASRAAEAHHESGWMDQFHSDDFLVYAYLQTGQDAKARAVLADADAAIAHYESMPGMTPEHMMAGMFPYYRSKLPIFIDLETRDWAKTLEIEPIRGAPAETQLQVYWARTIAAGHLRRADLARENLAAYDGLVDELRKGPHAYYTQGNGAEIRRNEIVAWSEFANGNTEQGLEAMRASAGLQDKVGQGEVDIPAREMLADMLLEAQRPQDALAEYRQALTLSPNRFNGLNGAGQAAEAAGDRAEASRFYAALVKSGGSGSTRPEIAHAKEFVSSAPVAAAPR